MATALGFLKLLCKKELQASLGYFCQRREMEGKRDFKVIEKVITSFPVKYPIWYFNTSLLVHNFIVAAPVEDLLKIIS